MDHSSPGYADNKQAHRRPRTSTEHCSFGLWLTAALNIPILLLSLFMALGVDEWRWVALACATPVVTWGGWPFHRATVVNARHGATTMDTLVSIGITTAYLWSAWAIVTGRDEIYLEVASAITLFLLLGRYFESGAKFRSGAALRALLDLGAKDVAVLRDGLETRVRIEQLAVASVRGQAGREGRRRRRSQRGRSLTTSPRFRWQRWAF
jgi:Cu+-exporting ATPase